MRFLPDSARKKEKKDFTIALVDPPFNLHNTPQFPWVTLPNPGLVAIASYLHREGYKVIYIDANTYNIMAPDPYARIKRELEKIKPDVVGLSAMSCVIYMDMYIAALAREVNPDVINIIGGIHVTFQPELTLRTSPDIDYAILNEGEITAVELIEELRKEHPELEKVRGIAYLARDFTRRNISATDSPDHDITTAPFIRTQTRPLLPSLDELPMGAYELLPMNRYLFPAMYREDWENPKGISLSNSRGCFLNCRFCANNTQWFCTYRARSGKLVADEIQLLFEKWGKSLFFFADQDFLLSRERNVEFVREMKKRKLPVKMWCETSARSINANKDLLGDLSELGLKCCLIGMDFGREKALHNFDKTTTEAEILECARNMHEADMIVLPSMIVGSPDESEETIDYMIDFIANRVVGRLVVVHVLNPLPGSKYCEDMMEEGKIEEFDFELYDTFTAVSPSKYSTREEIQGYRAKVEALTSLTWNRYKHFFTDERTRNIFRFELRSLYKRGLLTIRKWLYGEEPYHRFKRQLLKRQIRVMMKDPRWARCLENHLENWLRSKNLEL